MAEETKPVVEVPKDVAAPAAEPAVEAKPVETTEPVAAAPATEAAPVVEAPATTTTETPAPAAATTDAVEEAPAATTAVEEVKKEEVVPVEEGQLEHKGLNFPKNFIYSKQFFWFGSDAVDAKSLSHYRRSEKSAEAGHHNTAWASHTGKGLLFFGEKSAPVGVINLADATEPTTDGPTKFNFTSKGGKHAFKAANTADRDNWVSQLKLKIAEAKELASTITETETYKSTLESFKPAAPAKKEEAPAAAPAETTEAAAPVEAPAAVPTIETPPAVAEETPKEAPKERRSASRKRQSIFGSFFGQKEESKKEDKATEAVSPGTEAPKEEAAPAAAEPVVAPAPVEAAAPVAEAPATTEAAVEDKLVEKKEEKPVPTKRNSIFGVFGKKEKKAADAAAAEPAKETEAPVSSETAPALPPVETSTPLGEAVADAAPATVEPPKEEAAPATNGETKKDVKAEKRKSSLPFAFGKKDKSPSTSDEEGDKPEKTGPFSKLRATIKARGRSEKPVEKPEEKAEEKPVEAAPVAEASTSTEPAAEVAAKPAAEETVNKPAAAAPAAPVVTAAA